MPRYGCLYVNGEPLEFRIDERKKRIDHVLTESEKTRKRRGEYVYLPRWDYISTGELRLTVNRAHSKYHSRTWKDGARRRLEDQVNDILLALLDEAIRIKTDREERRLAEIERRRQEEIRWQQSQRRTANEKLVHELEAQAGAWFARPFPAVIPASAAASGWGCDASGKAPGQESRLLGVGSALHRSAGSALPDAS